MTTTLVVGDVHGCADELATLLDRVQPDETVLVGDLFTKGPDPAGVYDLVRDCRVVLGNHDQRLIDVLDGKRKKDAHARSCIATLDASDPAWRAWLRSRPLFEEAAGWTVVHAGLHPSGKRRKTTRKMAQLMRRWPMNQRKAPFWWQVYRGKRRVAYGHDALRGLVRTEREGRPWTMGLDTGCCYGGKLSGYVIEEDEVVQVEAARRYWDP